jgi:hypothetical protein
VTSSRVDASHIMCLALSPVAAATEFNHQGKKNTKAFTTIWSDLLPCDTAGTDFRFVTHSRCRSA